jgi:hypothetical protein
MNIHITKNGQQLGPYTLAEARQLVASGTLQAADWAWYEGIADWIPLQQVPGFAAPAVPGSLPASVPPPYIPSPVGRPVLVWVICLFYFICTPLSVLSIVATPYLLSFSARIQEKAMANLQTQVDHTTDPTERDRLISLQKRFHDSSAQVALLTHRSPGYYAFVILSRLLNLAAAILLFILRRSALHAFIAAFVVGILGTIYNYATGGLERLGASSQGIGFTIEICAGIVIGWGIGLAILYYVWRLSRKGILR